MKTEEEIKSIAHEIDNEHETKHYVKTWNNIKSHDEVIDERLKANMMKESNK